MISGWATPRLFISHLWDCASDCVLKTNFYCREEDQKILNVENTYFTFVRWYSTGWFISPWILYCNHLNYLNTGLRATIHDELTTDPSPCNGVIYVHFLRISSESVTEIVDTEISNTWWKHKNVYWSVCNNTLCTCIKKTKPNRLRQTTHILCASITIFPIIYNSMLHSTLFIISIFSR